MGMEVGVSGFETQRWRMGGLARRVLAAFLFLSVVPLALAAGLSTWQSTRMVERFLAENVGKTAAAWAADLDLFLEQQRRRLRAVPSLAVDRPIHTLNTAVAADPNVQGLLLLDGAGLVVADTGLPSWAVDACLQLRLGAERVMTHAGRGHAHDVVVAVPRRGGLLCGQVSFTLHQDMLMERADSVMGGTAYIVDLSGNVVCHAFHEDEPHVGRGEALGGEAARVASLGRRWAGMTQAGEGRAFAAYAPATELPWGVWVEVPKEGVAGPLRRGTLQVFGFAIVLALVAAGLAVWLVRRLIGPIQDVVGAVRNVAQGQYGAEIPVRGDDEIADLAREFNRMSQALAQSYAELDDRVAQRTRQLEAAREFSDLLLNTMKERILVVDQARVIVRANQAAMAVYGSDIVGCGCVSVHERAGAGSSCPVQRVLESGEHEHEERVYEHDGRTEILAVDTYPLPGGDAVVEISRDISDLKRIQAQLMHQEKMAALGTLAAGMAHEIGNPLASMSSELELLERMWDPEEARASLPVLRDQIRRMSKLLRELVEFGRRPSEAAAAFDPAVLLQDVARLLRHDPRGDGVQVLVEAVEGGEPLCSNRDRVLQVLVNLGINALDALAGDGRLTFRLGKAEAGTVRLEVVDDGPGLPDEVARQAFDPFFTTKPPGQGTGLGLFVSERIVEGLGGRLELDRASAGTTFVVVLPDCACAEVPNDG
jgi:C4-dicarboxylate-specific signal transduction histidine kinase